MSDIETKNLLVPSANITRTRHGQKHFVSDTDETGLGAVDAVKDDSAPASLWGEAWKSLRRRPMFWVAAVIIFAAIIISLFPQFFTWNAPRDCDLTNSLAGPRGGHPFGFDRQGCDIYTRVIYGARASVATGVLATICVTLFGGTLGALAGFFGGWLDAIISRITDIFFALPLMLGAIVFMQMTPERNILTVVIILTLLGWPSIARIARGAVMSVKNEEFVTAARALGASVRHILLSHIIPNAMAPIIVYATVAFGGFIVSEASLSFLGVGLPPSIVSWGNDISQAQQSLRSQPMVLFYPAMGLALTVLSFIMMGDAVRDALDPKSRKR